MEDLISNVKKAISSSGYPLEQRVGRLLEKKNWASSHSITYTDFNTGNERELDILASKLINDRKIELRISCKRSVSKPWIFFTEDSKKSLKSTLAGSLKRTPVVGNYDHQVKVENALKNLRFFCHDRKVINFTALSGQQFNNEHRSVVKDGIYSSITSVYNDLYPYNLIREERGTIYFFITLFDGEMFESYYDYEEDDDKVTAIDYAKYDTKFKLSSPVEKIEKSGTHQVSIQDVHFWFTNWFQVEIIKWSFFETYIQELEDVISSLSHEEINLFGKGWTGKYPTKPMLMPQI